MPKMSALENVVDNVKDVAGKVVANVVDAVSPAHPDAGEAPPTQEATALLKRDHDKVKALFAQAEALGDGAHGARQKLFKQIDAELTLHTQVEEEIFYPAFKAKTKRSSDERDEVLEAYEEHASAKELIAKLESTDPRDETYKAKLQVLGEMIRHHIREEETVLFPQAHSLLRRDELERLGARIEEAKAWAGGRASSTRAKAPSGKAGGAKSSESAKQKPAPKKAAAKTPAPRGGRAGAATGRARTTAKKRSR
jgi:hemerythrin superfamily protein